MSHPASRVLAMLELLQGHRTLTGAELAQRLHVDGRTIRRYAATLAELGVPVIADRGRRGGYRLSPGYKIPPLMLTDDEAVAVVLGLIAADRIGLFAQAPAAGTALAKIQRVLPAVLVDRLSAVLQTLGFTAASSRASQGTSLRADSPDAATVLTLGAASRDRRRVHLTYRSWKGAPSRRDVDPYGLVFHSGHWYVTGHDHQSDEIRTFRLDRIVGVEVRGDTFEPPADFNAVAHVTRSLAQVPYEWEVEVLLATDLAHARARIPATVSELAEAEGGVLLRTRAQRLDGMAQMLAGLGWAFTIIRPEELRAEVIAYAERLVLSAAPR